MHIFSSKQFLSLSFNQVRRTSTSTYPPNSVTMISLSPLRSSWLTTTSWSMKPCSISPSPFYIVWTGRRSSLKRWKRSWCLAIFQSWTSTWPSKTMTSETSTKGTWSLTKVFALVCIIQKKILYQRLIQAEHSALLKPITSNYMNSKIISSWKTVIKSAAIVIKKKQSEKILRS